MKVIFLDIDGVLNSDDYIDRAKNSQGIERHIDIDKVKLLKKAINKYGLENFRKEILHICENEKMAFEWEKIYIEMEEDLNEEEDLR